MANLINWFEIPATDLERAIKFYSAILGKQLEKSSIEGEEVPYAFLPVDGGEEMVGGAITAMGGATPSDQGTVVYLNGGADLNIILKKVEPAGGKVITPKTPFAYGFMAFFLDSEGNKVGLQTY